MPYVFNPFTGNFDWTVPAGGGGVPYTGATQNVNLGEYGITSGFVALDQTPTTATGAVSEISWNDGEGTAQIVMKGGSVTQQIGEQEYARCYNASGVTLTLGQVVYVFGAQGNRVSVKLAKANVESTSGGTIGLVAETIAAGAEGFVLVSGALYKLNTFGFTEGATVYLSETTAGAWTTTRPVAPNHEVILGWIERAHATVGSIYVKVDNGYELQELHNVLITTPANKQVLQYDSATSLWKNSTSELPAGTDGQIQYNNGGVLGGSTAYFEDTDQSVAVQNTTPQAVLHVSNTIGTSLNSPPTGSASLVLHTDLSAPTGYTTTAISELAAPGSFTVSQNTSSTGFTAYGQRFQYWIYALLNTGTVIYQSHYVSYATYTDTINDSSSQFANDLSWSAVSNATSYLIKRYDSYTANTYATTVLGTSYQDQGFDDTEAGTAWPTEYTVGTHPAYPPESLDEALQDGNYSGYTATGQTILYEIDSYKTISSVKYASGTPATISFTDDNSSNTYGVALNWTNGFQLDGVIVRKSLDSGTTWSYIDAGNVASYVDDNFADDGTSSAVWGSTYTPSGFKENIYNAYSSKTFPGGVGTYYSPTFISATVSLTAGQYSIIYHQLSGAPAGGWYKVIGDADEFLPSIDYGIVPATANFYDPGFSSWPAGPTVTPNKVGYLSNGSNLTRSYDVYTSQIINGVTTYSRTFKTITTTDPNNGNYYYITLSWGAVPGASGYKIIRGGTAAITEIGASTYDDNSKPYTATLTVTPNTYTGFSSRFDSTTTATTNYSQLQVIGIGASGSRYAKIGFGYSTGASVVATESNWIYNDNANSNLFLVGPSINVAQTLSSNPVIKLGVTTIFNDLLNNTFSLRVKGLISSYNLYSSAVHDTVYFGNYDGTDPVASIQVQPMNNGDSAIVLKWPVGYAETSNIFIVKNNAGNIQGVITGGAYFRAGDGSASGPSHAFYNDATCGLYRISAGNIGFSISGNNKLSFAGTAMTYAEGYNVVLGTSTGTKIGTTTSQKLGFWNATPIVQPTTATAAATFVQNTGTAVNDASTFDGYTLKSLVKALRNTGIIA